MKYICTVRGCNREEPLPMYRGSSKMAAEAAISYCLVQWGFRVPDRLVIEQVHNNSCYPIYAETLWDAKVRR